VTPSSRRAGDPPGLAARNALRGADGNVSVGASFTAGAPATLPTRPRRPYSLGVSVGVSWHEPGKGIPALRPARRLACLPPTHPPSSGMLAGVAEAVIIVTPQVCGKG
jgi:hypothetical protein